MAGLASDGGRVERGRTRVGASRPSLMSRFRGDPTRPHSATCSPPGSGHERIRRRGVGGLPAVLELLDLEAIRPKHAGSQSP